MVVVSHVPPVVIVVGIAGTVITTVPIADAVYIRDI